MLMPASEASFSDGSLRRNCCPRDESVRSRMKSVEAAALPAGPSMYIASAPLCPGCYAFIHHSDLQVSRGESRAECVRVRGPAGPPIVVLRNLFIPTWS